MTTLLLVLAGSLVLSALASLLEAVLVSVTLSHLAQLEERGAPEGRLLVRLRARSDEPIIAALTLSVVAQTTGAVVGGAVAFRAFGSPWVAVFGAALTICVLVLGEVVPRSLGVAHWKLLATPSAYLLRGLVILLKPLLIPLLLLRRWLVPASASLAGISRADLEIMAELGRREGTLDMQEWQVVSNVISLDQLAVSEVMTPRTSMVALPLEATVDEAKRMMLEEGHLRIPVYEGSIDRVVGVLLARDLWRADWEGVREIRHIVRSPTFVPGSKPVEDLIREMRQQRIKMAIVLDEYGGTAGLVTLEDLIEQIIGEIQDEHEQEPLSFEETEAGATHIRGDVPLWEVNERLGLSLPEELFDTLGGYIFGELGRIPEVGDEVELQPGLGRFHVVAMDGRRIERVAFVRAPQPEPPPAE